MPASAEQLPASLLEQTLDKLGFSAIPASTLSGLTALYGAWCRRVPFDNVRKLIHLSRKHTGPLPGDSAVDFLEAWLRHGVGGTCWAGNGALFSLLVAVGFDARRGLATMLAAPSLPPNHGTVVVSFGQQRYIVDASILHGTPLPIADGAQAEAQAPWGAHLSSRQDQWIIHWRPLHKPDGFECRLEELDVPRDTFAQLYERSRSWSPFNYQLYARINRADAVIGAAFGQRVELVGTGRVQQHPLQGHERVQFLVEEMGVGADIAAQLPPDMPTPSPPRQ